MKKQIPAIALKLKTTKPTRTTETGNETPSVNKPGNAYRTKMYEEGLPWAVKIILTRGEYRQDLPVLVQTQLSESFSRENREHSEGQ